MKEGGGLSLSNTSLLSGCAEKVKLLVKWYVGACIFLMHDGVVIFDCTLIYGGGDNIWV